MSIDIFLSYVLTTRNKLDLLKEIVEDIIVHKEIDDEIIVIDSNSSDGTADYLKKLAEENKIDFFISEPDAGEAHGFNKGMAHAKGVYIKILSDDDVFDWRIIGAYKKWLKNNPVDLVFSNGLSNTTDGKVVPLEFDNEFHDWVQYGKPFAFCGLGLFIRRESLPLLGYFHTSFKRVDAEFALRVTSCEAVKIAFSSDFMWFRRLNTCSNSSKYKSTIRREMVLLLLFYGDKSSLFTWLFRRFLSKNKNTKFLSGVFLNNIDRSVPSYQDCSNLLDSMNSNCVETTVLPQCGKKSQKLSNS